MGSMQWDDVRYFLALVESGSLSAAARMLRVEHTTVSRRAGALESALGVRLFDRLPRGWRLTTEGTDLLPVARRLEAEAAALERSALGTARMAGKVRISAAPFVISHFLLPDLERAARRRFPDVELELVGERRGVNLVRGEAEIALRVGTVDVVQGLVVRALGHVGYGLYGTSGEVRRPAPDRRYLGFDDSMLGTPQRMWLDEVAVSGRVILRTNDLLLLHRAAQEGCGIALLPHFLAQSAPGLTPLETPHGATRERPFSLLLHPDVRRSRRVKAVADAIIALAKARAAALHGQASRQKPRQAAGN
jgi:DNA-binding transcriptional LysR family regulator